MAVVAEGNGACAAQGFWDDMVIMGRWFPALEAFRHAVSLQRVSETVVRESCLFIELVYPVGRVGCV